MPVAQAPIHPLSADQNPEAAPQTAAVANTPAAPAAGTYSTPSVANTPTVPAAGTYPYVHDTGNVLAQWTSNVMMTTRPFHTDGPYEIQWTASTGYFRIYLVKVGGKDELIANQDEPGTSSSYVPEAGDYYLKVNADAIWTIKIVSLPTTAPASTDVRPLSSDSASQVADDPSATRRTRQSSPIKLSSEIPEDEAAVVEIVQAALNHYKTGQNDMQKGAARPMRARSICNVLSSRRAQNWVGTVTVLSTNGDGKGVLSIRIAPDIYVRTWNNSLSDLTDKTLIDPQTGLFKTVSELREGQKVRFSGRFVPSDIDCIKEQSLTLEGSITEPEFTMSFEAVTGVE